MKHLKKYNENIVDTRYQDIIPMLVKKLVKETKASDGDLESILDMVKDEWNKSEMPKEKPTFRTLSTEEKEQMMKDALSMSETQWMKKYPVGDHADYLRMAKGKWGLDESVSEDNIESEKLKAKIDEMSHEELARLWRNGSSDNKLFHGEVGEYFRDRLFKHFGGFNPSLSKKIGWGK